MKILGIDTASGCLSAALVEDGRLTCLTARDDGLKHSVNLMPMLVSALESHDLRPGDIDLFAVTNGPGSFTGLRIGVAAVKGMAFAADKPCAGVSTLEALAQALGRVCGLVFPVMDARRDQVYNAVFDPCGTRLRPDRAISLDALYEDMLTLAIDGIDVYLVGDGAGMCYDFLAAKELPLALYVVPPNIRMSAAYGAAVAGQKKLTRGEAVSASELTINYLRLPQAERERQGINN